MTTPKLGPARRLQLARALVELRERAGLKQAELAERADVSKQTVSRYEGWRDGAGISWKTVRDLATACGAESQVLDSLIRLARSSHDDGWWSDHSAVPAWMDPLIAFENWADHEHIYANSLVPGLLQTRAYNLATHQAQEVRRTPDEIEQQVDARIRRQEVLSRTPPINLWAVLDEAVLRRVVGDRAVMAEQMEHLLELSDQPNIEIQVLPFDAGATAAGVGHFLILGRVDGPGVVYVEMRRRGLYLDEDDDLAAYKLSFEYLRSQAAPLLASRRLVDRTRQEFHR